MNAAASRHLSKSDGLAVDRGELRAGRPSETARLRSCVADAVKTSEGTGLADGASLTISRSSGLRPCVVSGRGPLASPDQ